MSVTRRQVRVEISRAYDDPGPGYRVLVDRLWPRGVSKDKAALDEWAKEVAPSDGLRRWYGHEPAKFEAFSSRYRQELAESPGKDEVARLCSLARTKRLVLVTATRDLDHSGAVVLCDVITGRS
jgi:uncharacterized protein YeaO (DUF488 family)